MKINLLSSFAAGILITTTICGSVYFVDKSGTPKASTKTSVNQPIVKVSETEMKNKLESKGYVIQTKAEYDKNMNDAKAAAPKQDKPEDNNSAKNATRVVIGVSQGMTSIDVGKMLVEAKLVENAFNFSQEVENKGLDKNLKPGIFVVDSEMTSDQLITTIFQN